jgi:pimeloyl-ACP methyl ester carboxylesterase
MSTASIHPEFSETVCLNGLDTYYEVHGKGTPLLLLHGITQSSRFWYPMISDYSSEYEVWLPDLMGHGRSGPFTGKISVKAAAQNLADLIDYLNLNRPHAIGYSYGGEILFQLALLKPDLIKSMIIVGSCGSWRADDYPQFVEYLSYGNIENLPWMREQQESEERIKNILDQIPNYSIQVSKAELKRIQTPTLLVVGDNDQATPLECVIAAKRYMPNAYLWIVPNTEHRTHMGKNRSRFVQTSIDFLSGQL